MELQELAKMWHSSDKEIESKLRINQVLFKEVSINKIKSHLNVFMWNSIIEVIVNFLFLMFLAGFLTSHFWDILFSIPAGILIIVTFFSMVFSIYKLSLFLRIDSKDSIVKTQKNIERMKYYDRVEKNLLYVIIPVFFIAFMIVMAKSIFGFNLYQLGDWLVYNAIGSFAIAVIIVFFLKKYPDKNLQKSITFLKEVNEIENQE